MLQLKWQASYNQKVINAGVQKRESNILLVRMKNDIATMENRMETQQKSNKCSTYYLSLPLLGIYPQKMESAYERDILLPSL